MTECNDCGKEYDNLGQHWAMGSCSYPEIPAENNEIITGLLMGDGNINHSSKNPLFRVGMINYEFLDWLDNKLGVISTGVRLEKSKEELVKQNRKSGFTTAVNEENYNDYYMLHTRRMPALKEFDGWYSTGRKVFPSDIDLTPNTLKMWYVSDGNLKNPTGNNRRPTVRITCPEQVKIKDDILGMFKDRGFSPSWYSHSRKQDETIRFNVDESKEILKWMGSPPPGFEYKWGMYK